MRFGRLSTSSINPVSSLETSISSSRRRSSPSAKKAIAKAPTDTPAHPTKHRPFHARSCRPTTAASPSSIDASSLWRGGQPRRPRRVVHALSIVTVLPLPGVVGRRWTTARRGRKGRCSRSEPVRSPPTNRAMFFPDARVAPAAEPSTPTATPAPPSAGLPDARPPRTCVRAPRNRDRSECGRERQAVRGRPRTVVRLHRLRVH